MGNIFSSKSFISRYFSGPPKSGGPAKTGEIEVASSDGPAKTKGERQKGRADKKAARQQARAKKRIDRNEGKQARIKKNTQSSSDPAVRASGKARIERAKKRVKKNKTVSPDYVSKKDKANIAKNKKNKPGLKNPPPSSKQETPLSAADKGDDFDKFLSPAKKEPKRVKIESEGMAGQGSTEYIRGGREGDKNARSVTIEKDYAGNDQKVVRRKKKDGSVKTKSKKISSKKAERIKKRKDKSHSAVS